MTRLFAPKRIYIVLGIFVVANVLATFKVATDKSFFNSSDFIAYSIGAKMIMDDQGKNLYDLKLQTAYWDDFLQPYGLNRPTSYILPYLAPPITAILFIPYLFVPLSIRVSLAMGINALLVLAGTLIVGKTAKNLKLSLLVVFSSWFVWVCIWQIQPTAWLFLITALLYWSLNKKSFALAGLPCAFYIIKPQYLIVTPLIFLLTGKNAAFVKTFILSFLFLVGLNILISKPETLFIVYPKLLTVTDNPNYGNRWYEMYSIQQITYRFSSIFTKSKIPPLIVGGLFYLWGFYRINKLATFKIIPKVFPTVIMLTLLSAYHVLSQDMSIIVLANYLLLLIAGRISTPRIFTAAVGFHILGSITVATPLAIYYGAIYLVITILLLMPTNQKPIEVGAKQN